MMSCVFLPTGQWLPTALSSQRTDFGGHQKFRFGAIPSTTLAQS